MILTYCQRMKKKFIRSHTQIYVRDMLGISRVRFKHAVIRWCYFKKSAVTLQRMAITYCERMRKKFIRSHKQIYATGRLGIVVYIASTLSYVCVRSNTQRPKNSFEHVQYISAYPSVWNIRCAYAHHMLGVSWIR